MIHLIVGNTGAGKTTYSKALRKRNNGIIYSIDEWNNTLFMADKKESDGLDWFLERIERIETLIQRLIIQSEDSGIDSILDLGLSKYDHREKFRSFAKKHNFNVQLHYLDIPKSIRWNRVVSRNLNKGETFEFEVSESDFNFMEDWFEIPSKEELKDGIIITNNTKN